MEKDILPFNFFEKLYDVSITDYLPVIRKYEVSEGRLTDLFVKITFAGFYNPSDLHGFVRCIGCFMKDCHEYLGTKKPTVTISLYKEDEFVIGYFVEDDNYY